MLSILPYSIQSQLYMRALKQSQFIISIQNKTQQHKHFVTAASVKALATNFCYFFFFRTMIY